MLIGQYTSLVQGKQTRFSRRDFSDVIASWQDAKVTPPLRDFITNAQKYGHYLPGKFELIWNEIFKKSPVDTAKETFTLNTLEALNKDIQGKPFEQISPIIQNAWRLLK